MVSAQKTRMCPSCHKTLPISAFQSNDGRLFSRCLDCLYDEVGGDDGGGGGFQLDIIDKMAAIDRQLQLDKDAAAERFDAAEDRIGQQFEEQEKQEKAHDRQQEKKQQKNYRSMLFAGAEGAATTAAAASMQNNDAQSKTQQQESKSDNNKQRNSESRGNESRQQERNQNKGGDSKSTNSNYQQNTLFNNNTTTNNRGTIVTSNINSSAQQNTGANPTEPAQDPTKRSNEKAMNTRLFNPLTEAAATDAAEADSKIASFINSFRGR